MIERWIGIECGCTPCGVLVREETSQRLVLRTDDFARMAKRKALWAHALVEGQLHARRDRAWMQKGAPQTMADDEGVRGGGIGMCE